MAVVERGMTADWNVAAAVAAVEAESQSAWAVAAEAEVGAAGGTRWVGGACPCPCPCRPFRTLSVGAAGTRRRHTARSPAWWAGVGGWRGRGRVWVSGVRG